jgi:hypothetical protein
LQKRHVSVYAQIRTHVRGWAIEASKGAHVSLSEATVGERQRPQSRAKRPRSAVTSGRKLLLQGDPNSAWSRRYHDILGGHVADLGGADMLSEAQAALCRDAACLEIELERMRGMLSAGEKVDLDLYGRVAGQRRRILESLGLKREARPVMTLDAYLKARSEPVGAFSVQAASPVPLEPKARPEPPGESGEGSRAP